MVVRTVTMAEMKKQGAIPKSPIKDYRENLNRGNYNRFKSLQVPDDDRTRDRSGSRGKRTASERDGSESEGDTAAKAPRLDSGLVLGQLAGAAEAMTKAKEALAKSAKAFDEAFSAVDGAGGTAFFQLTEVVRCLIVNQEHLMSMVVDSVKVTEQVQVEVKEKVQKKLDSYADVVGYNRGYVDNNSHYNSNNKGKQQPLHQQRPAVTEEEKSRKRIRQAITKAEKSTLLFGLDMGNVPTMNKDTLARKVTINLHAKGKKAAEVNGKRDYRREQDIEEITDDMLTCASLDFLGSGTQKYANRFDNDDPNNGKYCTVPVKLIFKERQARINAEQHLRKTCQVKCSTPYPKGLRKMISELINVAKAKKNGCFIRVKVNTEKLTLEAHASVGQEKKTWEDLQLTRDIPPNILDRYEAMDADMEDTSL